MSLPPDRPAGAQGRGTPDLHDAPNVDTSRSSDSSVSRAGKTVDYRANEAPEPGAIAKHVAAGEESITQIGRYEIRRILGQGAFGTVYLGYDTQLGRQVAIKVPRIEAATPEIQEQFLREARQLAQLTHPGIVVVHDVGVEQGRCYIVSDFLEGPDLNAWLQSHQPTWSETVRIVAAMADALAHAHSKSIVHRDVKPANTILVDRAEGLQPVLVDFGLAIGEADTQGQVGIVSGTPNYLSPEQAQGKGHRVDGRTDIYALGVVLYWMLCGRLPFRATEVREMLRQVVEDDPQPPRQLVHGIPPELERICLKAMSKPIAQRYSTAGDMAKELRHVQKYVGEAIAQTPTVTYVVDAPAGRSSVRRVRDADTPAPAGKSSSSVRRAREAERRQVTVLACGCDLFDAAEFLEKLDPEEQHEVLSDYRRTWDQAVAQFGGSIVQSTGASTQVCFGYPVAFEDAAQRAVRTGLRFVESLAGLNAQLGRKYGVSLTTRIGVHTGLVVAGDPTEGSHESLAIVGEARNVATRLEELAPANAVVIGDATHRLVKGFFVCESLGPHAVKGIARPVEVFHVLRPGEARSRIEVGEPAGLTPLVGRDTELSMLRDRWEQAQEGMGQVVLIIGDAGLGKSRLIHEIKRVVLDSHQGEESPVLEWRCSPYHQNSSLNPASDFFERLLGFHHADSPQERFEKLVGHLQRYRLATNELVPLFATLLSVPLDARYQPSNLSPQAQKQRTLQALLDWLRAAAAERPILFILEDLHWVDATTLEFLVLLVEQGFSERVLTLLTFRPEFEPPWGSKAHQTQVALNRLTRRQMAEMMQKKLGVKKLPDEVVSRIVERTDGVPLFVEEFTTVVQESGALRQVGGEWQLSGSFSLDAIPTTLQDLLVARLDRMDSNPEVVQLGAVLGREFSHEVLVATCELDAAVLQDEVTKLVKAEILFQKGRPPQATYSFKHALIQDAAYSSLLRKKRQQFHQRIAQVLESQFAQLAETQPELLAHHFTEAGLVRPGIDCWLKAGQRSLERSANTEAISHLHKGLELIKSLDESRERDQLELEFQIRLGTALTVAKGYAIPDVGPVFARAHELCGRIGATTASYHVVFGIWQFHFVRDEMDRSLEVANELMGLARSLGDAQMVMEAYHPLVNCACFMGDLARAAQLCEEGFAQYDTDGCRTYSRIRGHNSGVSIQSFWAITLWLLGYPDQARQRIQRAIELARELKDEFSECYALYFCTWVHQLCRLWPELLQYADADFKLASQRGYQFWMALGALFRAHGLMMQGDPQSGPDQIRQGLSAFEGTGAIVATTCFNSFLVEAYWRAGRIEDGLGTLEETFTRVEKNNSRFYEAELHRLKGELLLARSAAPNSDAQAEAESCFRRAIEVARRQQAKSLELRTTMSLARLWQKQGKRDEASAMLSQVYSWFTEGFDTPDLVEAKALLSR